MALARKSYEVFLSFRGTDVRKNFVNHLYKYFEDKGIYTFFDDEELKKGEEISDTLMKAIEESRIAIVIFSKDYASSPWCLEELAKIMECKAKNDLIVLPVFFKVDPKEVRTPRIEQEYGKAMAIHGVGKDPEKVKKWKEALFDAGRLSGWHFTDGYEAELVREIEKETSTQLDRRPIFVANPPVGIESQVEKIKKILNLHPESNVLIAGLWGKGGVGKTTIAQAIYNTIFRDFQGSCFLERITENSKHPNGLIKLQERLLSQVLPGKNKAPIFVVGRGSQLIQERLANKRVLIILDDVENQHQLDALAGKVEWFGKGSRIIVTTRDKHVLISRGVNLDHIHEVEVLEKDEAHKLFRKYAFLGNQKTEITGKMVDKVLHYAKGLPLALQVLGSLLCGRKEPEWQSTLNKLARSPNKEINDVLKISYEGLDDNEKEIFLDIACFFKGRNTKYIKKVLNSCDFETTIGIPILIDRSLISEEEETLQMHDLIQTMGIDIVLEKYRDDPGKRSRLWLQDDVFAVLSRDEGTENIKAIVLELPKPEKINIKPTAFQKMSKLRLLILLNVDNSSQGSIQLPNALMWFQWPNCASIPKFSDGPKNLVGLDMRNSQIKVPEQLKNFTKLKLINYSGCPSLVYMPDLNCTPNLEELDLHGCKNLKCAHKSLACHGKLYLLNLSGCSKLNDFLDVLQSKNLRLLNLSLCSKFRRFPDIPDKMEGLRGLYLIGTSIEELPVSIKNLVSLEEMDLRYCKELTFLPSSIYALQNLEKLTLEGCSNLDKFPKEEKDPSDPHTTGFSKLYVLNLRGCNLSEVDFLKSSSFPFLRALYLLGNNFTDLPTCQQLHNLLWLDVLHSQQLQEIPKMPEQLRHLWAIGCESLSKFPPDTCDVGAISSQKRLPSSSTWRRDANTFAP